VASLGGNPFASNDRDDRRRLRRARVSTRPRRGYFPNVDVKKANLALAEEGRED
jgi:hypothetical protein